jgi:hypothetical protein
LFSQASAPTGALRLPRCRYPRRFRALRCCAPLLTWHRSGEPTRVAVKFDNGNQARGSLLFRAPPPWLWAHARPAGV